MLNADSFKTAFTEKGIVNTCDDLLSFGPIYDRPSRKKKIKTPLQQTKH